MIKNYFTIAIRHLFKNKSQSLLNILCLAVGMASILIVLTYVKYEFSFDKFIKSSDRIFRVERHAITSTGVEGFIAYQVAPLGPALKTECPEINDYTRIYQERSTLGGSYNDKNIVINPGEATWVDASFLTIFDCLLLKGDKNNTLVEPNTIVLTESIASIYFGEEEPIDKSIIIANEVYRVTGVCADPPRNTHFHYKYLLSFSSLQNNPRYAWMNGWRSGGVYLYVKLNPGFNKVSLEDMMTKVFKRNDEMNYNSSNAPNIDQKLCSITDIHLHNHGGAQLESNADLNLIRIIFIIGLFILLISLVNAINLATSKSLERAKEVGIRKVVGGNKSKLVYQFVSEFFLLNIVAMIIAVIIYILSPVVVNNIFSNFIFMPLEVLEEGWIWILILVLLIVNVLITGLYPAFILSSYKPLSVLQGKFTSSSTGTAVKKVLIVFQFVVTIALIAGVITITKQLNSMQSKNLGFDINNILVVLSSSLGNDSTNLTTFDSFKQELLKYNDINSISVSTDIPGILPRYGLGISLNKNLDNYTPGYMFRGGYAFLDVYRIKIEAGRNFSESFESDNNAVIISEQVSKGLNFKTPDEAINKFAYLTNGRQVKIIGVIADYNQISPKSIKTPIVIGLYDNPENYISINLNQTDRKNTIETINNLWKKAFPDEPFNYYFLKDFYSQQHILDIQFGNLINFFTVITILIISLGLWGMSSYTISIRTKELCIRRVLNARPLDITLLLFKYFFYLILAGAVIALPIAYYIFNDWLNNFAFKISIGWWFFALPILLITTVTILTIGYGIVKVSNKKLAETLKYE